MTLSHRPATKLGVFAAAVLYTAAGFGALTAPAVAEARDVQAFYTVELALPAAERTFVAAGVGFTCKGTRCTAPKSALRPIRVCRELQRDAGAILSFAADGEELDAEKLAKCNR